MSQVKRNKLLEAAKATGPKVSLPFPCWVPATKPQAAPGNLQETMKATGPTSMPYVKSAVLRVMCYHSKNYATRHRYKDQQNQNCPVRSSPLHRRTILRRSETVRRVNRMLKEELNDLQEALRIEKKFNRGTEKFQGRKPRSGLENQDDEDWDKAFEFRVC